MNTALVERATSAAPAVAVPTDTELLPPSAPETPVAETPAAETPAAETPSPGIPVPEAQLPEIPVAEILVPEIPVPETPVPRSPSAEALVIEALVIDAVAGDGRAKDRLLAEIQPMALRYCRGRLGRQETVIGSADDVAQEVCLAVVGALSGYTVKGLSFRAFVYGIAAHKVTDAFRAIGRNRAEAVADLPDAPTVADGPEQRLLAGELTERLGSLLHRLTTRQREVLVLRIAVGLSAEETAQAVGSTPGAVRVTQHRALNRLREEIAAPGADGNGEDVGGR